VTAFLPAVNGRGSPLNQLLKGVGRRVGGTGPRLDALCRRVTRVGFDGDEVDLLDVGSFVGRPTGTP